MALFVIERNFAEMIEATKELADEVRAVNDDEGIRWLYSFLSADKRKSYCLYEATDPEGIRRAAQRLGIPADVIIAVEEIRPEAFV